MMATVSIWELTRPQDSQEALSAITWFSGKTPKEDSGNTVNLFAHLERQGHLALPFSIS
jgi:hypothetical protein